MSQIYNLPDGSTSVATNLLTTVSNDLETLRSSFSGPNAPTNPTPVAGQLWFDTTINVLKRYNGSTWEITVNKTPSSAIDTGTAGEICWDMNYIYICVSTNAWKRMAISTW